MGKGKTRLAGKGGVAMSSLSVVSIAAAAVIALLVGRNLLIGFASIVEALADVC